MNPNHSGPQDTRVDRPVNDQSVKTQTAPNPATMTGYSGSPSCYICAAGGRGVRVDNRWGPINSVAIANERGVMTRSRHDLRIFHRPRIWSRQSCCACDPRLRMTSINSAIHGNRMHVLVEAQIGGNKIW